MAQNTTVAVTEAWTQLTNANATSITFENKGPETVRIAITTSAVAPSDFTTALDYQIGTGEKAATLADLAPGIAGVRVYAYSHGSSSDVYVSHA